MTKHLAQKSIDKIEMSKLIKENRYDECVLKQIHTRI